MKQLCFYYKGGIEMNGEGLLPKEERRLEEFLEDLSEEVGNVTGYYMGVDYSFFVNYDRTLNVDSSDDKVLDAVQDYIFSKYHIEFKEKAV